MRTVTRIGIGVAAAGLFVPLAGLRPASAAKAAFVTNDWSITAGAPMNPLNGSGNYYLGLDVLPLAIENPQVSGVNGWFPALASRWQVKLGGREVIVHLQPKARWSNGRPVTATDVKDSAALYFLNGTMEASAIGSVRILNAHTVAFSEAPHSTYGEMARGVLSLNVLPASVYGRFLPKDIWTIIQRYQYTGTNAHQLALKQAATKQVTQLLNKVSAYAPPVDVSAGPYVVKTLTPAEVQLVKNPDFYDASRIRVPVVDLRLSTSNQQIWNWLESSQADLGATGGMSQAIVNKIASSGVTFYKVPDLSIAALMFNEHHAPYNLTAVRQAFAYIINRQSVWKVGEPVGGYPIQHITGLTDAMAKEFLTPSQLSALNPYAYNPARAAKLLESAGFKKVHGTWHLPNGKPFTQTLYSVSGYNDWDQGATVIQSELSGFGIPTKVDLLTASEYTTDYEGGKLGLYINNVEYGPFINEAYTSFYGTGDGYNVLNGKLTYTADTGNYTALPERVTIPHYGRVNPGQLTFELSKPLTKTTRDRLVSELATVSNEYLPGIPLWDYAQSGFVNMHQFTDYPPFKSGVFQTVLVYYPGEVGIWQMMGYLKPRG